MLVVFFILYALFYWLSEAISLTYYVGRIYGYFIGSEDFSYWGQKFNEDYNLVIPFLISAILTYLIYQRDLDGIE